MSESKNIINGEYIIADLYSRPNTINGKYRTGKLGLDNLADINSKDIFFLETLRMKADLADKMIEEAESQGKNTEDAQVMRELGVEINAIGSPVHKSESVMTALSVSLQLILYYGIAIGLWGLVFSQNFFSFALYGSLFAVFICLFSVAPVIAGQRTKQKIRTMVDGAGNLWGTLGLVIGIIGLIVLVLKLILFR